MTDLLNIVEDVIVLLGQGDGTVIPSASFVAGDAPSSIVVGDLDGSGGVGFSDGPAVLAGWGPCPPSGPTSFDDLLEVLANRGPCS